VVAESDDASSELSDDGNHAALDPPSSDIDDGKLVPSAPEYASSSSEDEVGVPVAVLGSSSSDADVGAAIPGSADGMQKLAHVSTSKYHAFAYNGHNSTPLPGLEIEYCDKFPGLHLARKRNPWRKLMAPLRRVKQPAEGKSSAHVWKRAYYLGSYRRRFPKQVFLSKIVTREEGVMIIPSAQVAELTDSDDGDASEWAKDAVTDDTVEILLSEQIKSALALKDEKGVKPASGRAPASVGDTGLKPKAARGGRLPASQDPGLFRHDGFSCNSCHQEPILGSP